MATLVGTQKTLVKLLAELIELDYDAAEAYQAAIERLADFGDREQLAAFKADHIRHTQELSAILQSMNEVPPHKADLKAVVTKGKVIIGSLMGERTILMAMKSNENDTNEAYDRAIERHDLPVYVRSVLERNWADERRHRAWLEQRIDRKAQVQAQQRHV